MEIFVFRHLSLFSLFLKKILEDTAASKLSSLYFLSVFLETLKKSDCSPLLSLLSEKREEYGIKFYEVYIARFNYSY